MTSPGGDVQLLRIAAFATLVLSAPLRAEWQEVRTRHFIVYADASQDSARKFATDLEGFDEGLRKFLGLADREGDDANPLTVFVVDNVGAVNSLCRSGQAEGAKAREACRYVAGFYDGRVSGSVAFVPRSSGKGPLALTAQTILFHEYAHHLMRANSRAAYPAWYSEGFAEFVSNAKLDRKGEIGIGMPANSRAWSLYTATPIPVSKVLTVNPATLDATERTVFYGRAWLLTHYLSFSDSRTGQLTAYLTAINAGKSSADAASSTFGDLDALNKEVESYLRRNRFGYLPLPLTPLASDAVRLRRLGAGEAAMMEIRLQSQRSVDEDSAGSLAAKARSLAARWPGDSGAQLILAEAEYDAGNDDAVEAAADRVLAAAPEMSTAMIYKALAIMHRARAGKRSDDVIWRAARMWLLKANRLQPDAAWPLVLFYRSFIDQGIAPTANAVSALERGAELVPQDGQVRMMLVGQYLRAGKLAHARAALIPLAFDPHADANNPARRLMERIDRSIAAGSTGRLLPAIDPSSDDGEDDQTE